MKGPIRLALTGPFIYLVLTSRVQLGIVTILMLPHRARHGQANQSAAAHQWHQGPDHKRRQPYESGQSQQMPLLGQADLPLLPDWAFCNFLEMPLGWFCSYL
jgi:hypothetical protein